MKFFLTILVFLTIGTYGSFSVDEEPEVIDGYQAPLEGVCGAINTTTGELYQPNYLGVVFQTFLQNCTDICDSLPTCSGVAHAKQWFKSQCNVYMFKYIEEDILFGDNTYLNVIPAWLPQTYYEELGDQHVSTNMETFDSADWYCYIRITEAPSNSPSFIPTTFPSFSPSVIPTVDPTTSPFFSPSTTPSTRPTVSPSFRPSVLPTDDPSVTPTAHPSYSPTWQPTAKPSDFPSVVPTKKPSEQPSQRPSVTPSFRPSVDPSFQPSVVPSVIPSVSPSYTPTTLPSFRPSVSPTNTPSDNPSHYPTHNPSCSPTVRPTFLPSTYPTIKPSDQPSTAPSHHPSGSPTTPNPTVNPTIEPTDRPSVRPSINPTGPPSEFPTHRPSVTPSINPTGLPSCFPTHRPSVKPSISPSDFPTVTPSDPPSFAPTIKPSDRPSCKPTVSPSFSPTVQPTDSPTDNPSVDPSYSPSVIPSVDPSYSPSTCPSDSPSVVPTDRPSVHPTNSPSWRPTVQPSDYPSVGPTVIPSHNPSVVPTVDPSYSPTVQPSDHPSVIPTVQPSWSPSVDPSVDPSFDPTIRPTFNPSTKPTVGPSFKPSTQPSCSPSEGPTLQPTDNPSVAPTVDPTPTPTRYPSLRPTVNPSLSPSFSPTVEPSVRPTVSPTRHPSYSPSVEPSLSPTVEPSVAPSLDPSVQPTVSPSFQPSFTPTVTSPCSVGKLNVIGSHYIWLNEEESYVDDEDWLYLAFVVPERYTLVSVYPSDATTTEGYYNGTNSSYWSTGDYDYQECSYSLTGGFPWAGIQDQTLMGLTVVENPTNYDYIADGVYFHNIITVELEEEYEAPEGWAKPGDTGMITRKLIYEIPVLIQIQTEMILSVNFTVVIPTFGPTTAPSFTPSVTPTMSPSFSPTVDPTVEPTKRPTVTPTVSPTVPPTVEPTADPSGSPSVLPTVAPSGKPTVIPTADPSTSPTVRPSARPSMSPTERYDYYANVTVRADETFFVKDFIPVHDFFGLYNHTQTFYIAETPAYGDYYSFGALVNEADEGFPSITLGEFTWVGENITDDTVVSFLAESLQVRVRIDVLLLGVKDCIAAFTEYTNCSVTCDEGTKTRTWIVDDPADAAGWCDYEDGYVEVVVCEIESCPVVDEVVTQFAVYNPDLDENSTVHINFTTITVLPWKVQDHGFTLHDPNNLIDLNSVAFYADPIESCWPYYNYTFHAGICGETTYNEFGQLINVQLMRGMYTILGDDPEGILDICRNVCDWLGTDCQGYDYWPNRYGGICSVLGLNVTENYAEAAQGFLSPGKTWTWYEGNAQTITGGVYAVETGGGQCFIKTDPIYEGYCAQTFGLMFDMDFVCNVDDTFILELTVQNLLTDTAVAFEFESQMSTDAACATIIGEAELMGTLLAYDDPSRETPKQMFYIGETIYFTATLDSYAKVSAMSLDSFVVLQDESPDAVGIELITTNATIPITLGTSTVDSITQHFITDGHFSFFLQDPVHGSVQGDWTKWTVSILVTFQDGSRRQLLASSFSKKYDLTFNALVYPAKCTNPDANAGDYVTYKCGDTGQRIMYCSAEGWQVLMDECGDLEVTSVIGLEEEDGSQNVQEIVIQDDSSNVFIWRLAALTIGIAIVVGCLIYYILLPRFKNKDKVSFLDESSFDDMHGDIIGHKLRDQTDFSSSCVDSDFTNSDVDIELEFQNYNTANEAFVQIFQSEDDTQITQI